MNDPIEGQISGEESPNLTLHIEMRRGNRVVCGVDALLTKDDLRFSRLEFCERFLLPAATQLIGRAMAEVKP